MHKKLLPLMCLLMVMVWAAGCSCPAERPVVAAPIPVVEPPPPPPPVYTPPKPVVQPAPSKKLKQRVIIDRDEMR